MPSEQSQDSPEVEAAAHREPITEASTALPTAAPTEPVTLPATPAVEVHRLHPLSLLFRMGGALRSLFLPLVLFVFFSSKGDDIAWIAWAFGVSMVYAVVKYVTCRYRFAGDEMVVTGGLVFRFERHIPYARIQNIDLSQSVFHRLLRVADVKIETASGSTAEAHLQVLSLDAVEKMRARVFSTGTSLNPTNDAARETPCDAAEPPALVRLGARDLLLFGLLSNRGMAVALAALGFAYEFGLFDEEQLEQLEHIEGLPLEGLPGLGADGSGWPLLLTAGIVILLIVMRMLSVLWAFWKLHGFTLVRSGDDLRTSCGLFTRWTATIPRSRIQAVTVSESWLHRRLGLASVKVDTAGGSQLEEKAATRSYVAPIIARARLGKLLDELQPGLALDCVDWRPVHPCGRTRRARKHCAVLLVLGALAAWWWWSPLVLVALPILCVPVAWEASRRVAALGYGLDGAIFAVRHGLWTRTTRVARCNKVQVIDLRQSPFDRRWGTVSLGVDIAGTDVGLRVPFLDEGMGHRLQQDLARYVEELAAPRPLS